MTNLDWFFPYGKGIRKEAINNAAAETFKSKPLPSLAREVIQNSLDVQVNDNEPVTVSFKTASLRSSDFPNKKTFEEVLKKAKSSWPNDSECQLFVDNAEKVLSNNEIPYLKISDYNTTGLTGAGSDVNGTQWSSLVKEVGSSPKGEDSQGSFGIGKAAPFACSDLRTVFYTTKVEQEGIHSIGVSNLVSFDLPDGMTAQGVGFYEDSEGQPIKGNLSFDTLPLRNNQGTDIYIMGFDTADKYSEWENEVILAVVENFMVSIIEGKLIVEVNDHKVDKNFLSDFVVGLDDKKFKNTKNYYEVLTSPDSIRIYLTKDFTSEFGISTDEAALYLLKKQDANRKILMARKSGMKVFEKANISGSIQFTGVFFAKGTTLNTHLKIMENPAHTEWASDRHKNKRQGKKLLSLLYRFLKETVINEFQEQFTDEVDAHNMSEYLPDISNEQEGQEKIYGMNQRIKEVNIKSSGKMSSPSSTGKKVKKRKKKKLVPVLDNEGAPDYFELGGGFPTKEETPGPSPSPEPNPNPSPGPNPGPNPGPTPGTSTVTGDNSEDLKWGNKDKETLTLEEEIKKTRGKISCPMTLIENKNQAGSYNLIIQKGKSADNPIIELKMIGETQGSKPIIVNANRDASPLRFEKNLIKLDKLQKDSNTVISFQINMKERVRLEVNVYAG